MFFRRKKKTAPKEERNEDIVPRPIDPALYGKLVNGELPVGWVQFHREFLEFNDSVLLELDRECGNAENAGDEETAAAMHEQCVVSYREYEKQCRDRGECFVKHFEDNYKQGLDEHIKWLENRKK